ncbi:MAG TPA: asparagine synthase (glutamine-hydrolyzing), partial [Gemmatimonadales bacterium]|nr:asparagine synthase (glutamine-hydrolyzing) [Gemmatimonadales bacterium]
PMANEDGSVRVVFNGEIYNYRALTAELKAQGHRFRGTSDTEVLVHLYEELGERMVSRLAGIFAFAIYDSRRRQLLLARDRFGVKPLFYAVHDGQCVFASEMKAILAAPGFRPAVDRQACYDFLGLGYIPEPATGFANIHALPKASCAVVDARGLRIRPYECIEPLVESRRSLADATTAVAEALLNAVSAQSVADVPVAALLSGGIDSSLVVAAHRVAGQDTATTFNVRFPDRAHDETSLALAVSRQYGTNHHTIDLADGAMQADAIFDLLRHFDQPFADTSFLPMYWISRAVRERGIICTLSGDGGDEAFGGYPRFWRAERLAKLMRLPAWVSAAADTAGAGLARWTRDWGRQVSKAARLAHAGRKDSAVILAGLSNYLAEDQKQTLVRPDARAGLQSCFRHFDGHQPPAAPDLEELSRRMTGSLFDVSLPSDMLRKVDMMSMRASIEVRVPLLDERLVAIGLSLPHRLKTDGRRGKLVLRELAARWLPPAVTAHPKHGFTVPLDVMMPADVHAALADVLLGPNARTRPVLDTGLVESWLRQFRAARAGRRGGVISRAGLYQRIFMALALELWLREWHLSW